MRKKITANVSGGIDSEGINITIQCSKSRVQFVDFFLSFEEIGRLMSGQYLPDIKMEVGGLEYVGLVKEAKELLFPIHKDVHYMERKKYAIENAQEFADKGWTADLYFGSQESFRTIDGVEYAKTKQFRYVAAKD